VAGDAGSRLPRNSAKTRDETRAGTFSAGEREDVMATPADRFSPDAPQINDPLFEEQIREEAYRL
jgi:hypothetical protein